MTSGIGGGKSPRNVAYCGLLVLMEGVLLSDFGTMLKAPMFV